MHSFCHLSAQTLPPKPHELKSPREPRRKAHSYTHAPSPRAPPFYNWEDRGFSEATPPLCSRTNSLARSTHFADGEDRGFCSQCDSKPVLLVDGTQDLNSGAHHGPLCEARAWKNLALILSWVGRCLCSRDDVVSRCGSSGPGNSRWYLRACPGARLLKNALPLEGHRARFV